MPGQVRVGSEKPGSTSADETSFESPLVGRGIRPPLSLPRSQKTSGHRSRLGTVMVITITKRAVCGSRSLLPRSCQCPEKESVHRRTKKMRGRVFFSETRSGIALGQPVWTLEHGWRVVWDTDCGAPPRSSASGRAK